MKNDEILNVMQLEHNRTAENLNTIYLYKESENTPWYLAFELSAYLMEFYPNGLKDTERLKPTHRVIGTDGETYIKVSLQIKSFEKYAPDYEVVDTDPKTIEIKTTRETDLTLENYNNKLNEWKSGVKISPDKKRSSSQKQEQMQNISAMHTNGNLFNKPSTFLNIMSSILSYDTHAKTEEELRYFIISTKEKCASIIC